MIRPAQSTPVLYNNAGNARYVIDVRPSRGAFFWGATSGGIGDGTAGSNGHYYGQRANLGSRRTYKDGVFKAENTVGDNASGTNDTHILVCGSSNGTGIYAPWPGRGAVAYMTDGTLSDADVTALHSLLSTYLITPTGR